MEILEMIKKEFEAFELKKQEFVDTLKPQFGTIFNSVFEKYPELQAFKWTQYTPFFMDGDTCEFSVNECYDICLVGSDEFIDRYTSGFPEELKICITDINQILFDIPEEIMKQMFDDHVEVILDRTTGITVEEYDHD